MPDNRNSLFAAVSSSSGNQFSDVHDVLRSRTVQVNTPRLLLLGQPQASAPRDGEQLEKVEVVPYIQLNLFDDILLRATHTKNHANNSGSQTWHGTIEGHAASTVIFVINKDSVYGLVEVPDVGSFSIHPNADGTHSVNQIKANALLSGEDDFVIPESTTPNTFNAPPENSVAISNDNGSIIDVYVAYDQDASGGSVAAVDAQSYAELFMAYTNQAYENSNINQRVWLVGSVDGYNYTDTNSSSLSAELAAAESGSIAGLHNKRDEYHADLVLFFSPYDSVCNGLAYLQTSNADIGWNTSAFSAMTACSFGQSVFAHELGHNMGSRHDWYVDSGLSPAPIAHGYIDITNRFRTIMSYANRCSALGVSCPTIPHFANPAISYSGAATGVTSGTSSSCSTSDTSPSPECDADNGTNFNSKALITSQFRDSRVTWTGNVDTSWSTAGNWSFNQGAPGATTAVNRVPRSYDNVFIPAGLTNYPIVTGASSARELVIADGASLTMTAGTLTVGWSWEDQGGFNAIGGTVIFAGPIGVTVESSSTFLDVQIGTGTDTSSVTLGGNLDVDGNLHIQAGASFNAGSNTINLAGNWTEDGATGFASSGTSTVIFDGGNQAVSKVTSVSLLNENFSSYDSSCCTSGKPSGWADSDGTYFQGDLIIDANGAANRWRNQTDGYLYTPALSLQTGIVYQLQYDVAIRQNFSDGDGVLSPQAISVHLGSAQSSGAMTEILSSESSETSTSYQTRTVSNITVSTNGTYYIGFRAQQSGDDYASFDNIALTGVGSIAFHNLHISSGLTTFSENVRVNNNLEIEVGGTIDLVGNSISVEGTVINNGAIKQTKTIANTITTAFGQIKNIAGTNKYVGIEITPSSGSMGATTVEIEGNQTCSGSGIPTNGVKRCYVITPGSSQTADVKFFYRSAESNGNTDPNVYLKSGSSWTAQTTPAHGGSSDAIWATGSGLTSYGTFSLSTGATSNSTKYKDFNADGVSDVIIRNATSNGWYLYNLNNDLTVKDIGGVGLTTNASWKSLVVEDFNNDGYADVLVRNKDTGGWYLYNLDGNRGVNSGVYLPLNNSLDWVFKAAHDFNRDGFTDILMRNSVTNGWYIYYLNGSGGLASGSGFPPFTADSAWEYKGVADFNSDGYGDIMIRHQGTGQWYIYHLNGSNGLAANSGMANLPVDLDWQFMGIADLDNDGKPDVLLRSKGSGTYNQQILNGARSVDQAKSGDLDISTASKDWELQTIGYYTDDNIPDLLVRHKTNGSWYVHALDGQKGLVAGKSGSILLTADKDWQTVPLVEQNAPSVMADDFNSDGFTDILVRKTPESWWHLYQLDGNKVPQSGSGGLPLTGDSNWKVKAKADFNGDGYTDILMRHNTTHRWYIYYLNGSRGLASGSGFLPLTLVADWQFQAVADFNGDGNLDILIRNSTTNGWYVYHLDGNSGLAVGSGNLPLTSDVNWQFKAVNDFNADGKQDVLIRHASTNGWYVYHLDGNKGVNGDSGFVPLTNNSVWKFKAANDFNGDGKPDILVRNTSTNAWYLYHLDGNKGLAAGSGPLPLTSSGDWQFLAANDYNADTNTDVLIRNLSTGGWYVYHLDGNKGLAAGSGFLPLSSDLGWVFQ